MQHPRVLVVFIALSASHLDEVCVAGVENVLQRGAQDAIGDSRLQMVLQTFTDEQWFSDSLSSAPEQDEVCLETKNGDVIVCGARRAPLWTL